MMAMSSGDVWSYRPPLSLWHLVEQNVSPEQQEELRSMLGTSLIETTMDLHNEVDMLLEIWREYQDETEAEQPRPQTLAEPPHIRERLVKEICFLAEGVREKSLRKGMNPSEVFTGHNSQILDYVEEAQQSGSSTSRQNPMSARSIDGRQTPLSPSDVARSRSVLSDTIQDDVSSAADKLNYMQFGEVCSRLRETLSKEVEQLESDVVFLHSCLDQAADARSNAASPALFREPTLTELREERSLLEKELLSAEKLPRTPAVSKPSFLAMSSPPTGKIQNLTPVKTRLRPAVAATSPSGTDRGSNKTVGPLRACHPSSPDHPSTSSSPDITIAASPDITTAASPDSAISASPNRGSSVAGASLNRITAQTYNLDPVITLDPVHPSPPLASLTTEGVHVPREDSIRRHRHGSGNRRRTLSPARVKVVPVGSIIPTPPSADKPHLPRPSSADRFRKMVMHSRETT